jgi:hypothetical protein
VPTSIRFYAATQDSTVHCILRSLTIATSTFPENQMGLRKFWPIGFSPSTQAPFGGFLTDYLFTVNVAVDFCE